MWAEQDDDGSDKIEDFQLLKIADLKSIEQKEELSMYYTKHDI